MMGASIFEDMSRLLKRKSCGDESQDSPRKRSRFADIQDELLRPVPGPQTAFLAEIPQSPESTYSNVDSDHEQIFRTIGTPRVPALRPYRPVLSDFISKIRPNNPNRFRKLSNNDWQQRMMPLANKNAEVPKIRQNPPGQVVPVVPRDNDAAVRAAVDDVQPTADHQVENPLPHERARNSVAGRPEERPGAATSEAQSQQFPFRELNKYKKERMLGAGGNGACYLIRRLRQKTTVACKVVRGIPASVIEEALQVQDPALRKTRRNEIRKRRCQILAEVHFMLRLNTSDRIAKLAAEPHYEELGPNTQIYMQYYDGGDLDQLWRQYYGKERKRMPESFMWHAFYQIAQGLAYMHHGYNHTVALDAPLPENWKAVIHADLKPANCLLRSSKDPENVYPDIVIADFGAATYKAGNNDQRGTSCFQPPECPEWSTAGDVWALGASIHALCHLGETPTHTTNPSSSFLHLYRTVKGFRDEEIADAWHFNPKARMPRSINQFYSQALDDAMMDCLHLEKNRRPDAMMVLEDLQFAIDALNPRELDVDHKIGQILDKEHV